jgi:mannose-6-phosphate isomerase
MCFLPVLKFDPLFKSAVWGGSDLGLKLNKSIKMDSPVGESWELVDLPQNQSVVTAGRFKGYTLEKLRKLYLDELMGTAKLLDGRFPLLFKFIDAKNTLSVQVHPDQQACEILKQGARPKTEAWYIIDCKKDAILYAGLKTGVTRQFFERSLNEGTVEECLHSVKVKPGDYIYLPAGTVHAIGRGILLAEVQQSSDTTYRVFDWNRMGLDGRPRELHIEQALESINFGHAGAPVITPPVSNHPGIRCSYFEMETIVPQSGNSAVYSNTAPLVVMAVNGTGFVTVTAGETMEILNLGETALVPACISQHVEIAGHGTLSCVVTSVVT